MNRYWSSFLLSGWLMVSGFAAQGAELVIVAPNNLAKSLSDIALRFERSAPGVKVRFRFLNGAAILEEGAAGEPSDILVTPDLESMDEAAARKMLMNDTRRVIIRDRLVVIAPVKSTLRLTSLADLLRGDLRRVAVGLPDSVPSGQFAKQALEAAGLWQALYGKFVFAPTTGQSLGLVTREEVDVGFALLSEAIAAQAMARKVMDIDLKIPILCPIAVSKRSPSEKLARSFVDFAGTAEAWQVFDDNGFMRP
jgi:molybdate transport system substrate-binding protein